VHTTCPHQRSLFILIHLTIRDSSNYWYISLLCLLLQSPLSYSAPKMHLRILLSNEHRNLSSIFFNVQVSDAYIITGLTDVFYISSLVFLDTS
jgi:hypothetical protein